MFGIVPFVRKNAGVAPRNDFWGMNSLFDDFFSDSFFGRMESSPIRADVRENENEWLIDAEIPGVDKNDIQIELENGYLTVSVEQKNEVNEEKENYIRKERFYGSTKRSFFVDDVKEDEIKASYKDGILSLNVPKAKPNKKQNLRIDIQ